MSERRLSLGINVSILVILTIFGVLLSLPLRLLLNTNYHSRNQTGKGENATLEAMKNATMVEAIVIPLDHRKLRRCPRFGYEDRLKSVFRDDYDGNCTYAHVYKTVDLEKDDEEDGGERVGKESEDRPKDSSSVSEENVGENLTESTEESGKDRRMKSVPVAGHILVTMLLISAIAALVEVLRIRFARDKVMQL